MEEQLLRMSVSDALTGTPNRRAFDQALRGEWRRSSRAAGAAVADHGRHRRLQAVQRPLRSPDRRPGADRRGPRADRRARARGGPCRALRRRGIRGHAPRQPTRRARPPSDNNSSKPSAASRSARRPTGSSASRSAPPPGIPIDELIKSPVLLGRADEALYEAKSSGKRSGRRLRGLAVGPRRAAGGHRRRARPTGSSGSTTSRSSICRRSQAVAFEALMRWERPGHGLVAPAAFIPAAEASTLICDLGRWALHQAANSWRPGNAPDWTPPAALRSRSTSPPGTPCCPSIVDDVQAAVDGAGIAASPARDRTDRDRAAAGRQRRPPARRAARSSARRSPSTTSAPATPRSPRWPTCPPTSSRSTACSPPQRTPGSRSLVRLMIEAAHAFDLRVVAEGIEDQQTLQAHGRPRLRHRPGLLHRPPDAS